MGMKKQCILLVFIPKSLIINLKIIIVVTRDVIDDLIKKVEGNFYTEGAKRIVQKRIVFLRTF